MFYNLPEFIGFVILCWRFAFSCGQSDNYFPRNMWINTTNYILTKKYDDKNICWMCWMNLQINWRIVYELFIREKRTQRRTGCHGPNDARLPSGNAANCNYNSWWRKWNTCTKTQLRTQKSQLFWSIVQQKSPSKYLQPATLMHSANRLQHGTELRQPPAASAYTYTFHDTRNFWSETKTSPQTIVNAISSRAVYYVHYDAPRP